MKFGILLSFLFFLLFIACGKTELLEDATSFEAPARLEVQVRRCLDAACDSIVQAPGARVFLFENEQYRSEGSPFAYDGVTNGFGVLKFEALDSSQYWLSIKLPEPDGRVEMEYVKTPKRTTTFVDVIFAKE